MTLGTALPDEMARVAEEVLPAYAAIGKAGEAVVYTIHRDLGNAARALAEGDLIEMIRAYKSLKGWSL